MSPKEVANLMPEMTVMGLHRGDYGRSANRTRTGWEAELIIAVTVAMSGGVDSSVALRILSEMVRLIQGSYDRL